MKKKKSKKLIFAIVLSFCMIISTLCVTPVFASENNEQASIIQVLQNFIYLFFLFHCLSFIGSKYIPCIYCWFFIEWLLCDIFYWLTVHIIWKNRGISRTSFKHKKWAKSYDNLYGYFWGQEYGCKNYFGRRTWRIR